MSDYPDLEPEPDETEPGDLEPDMPEFWKELGAEWVDAPLLAVDLRDPGTNEIVGTVEIPYDPDNRPTDEEAGAAAQQLWARLEHVRSIVKQEAVDDLAGAMKDNSADEIFAALADPFDALRIRIGQGSDVESGPGRFAYHLDETIDAGELEDRVNELWRRAAPSIIESVADAPAFGELGETFWQYWAREAIAHALAILSDVVAQEMGPDVSDEEHERRVLELYEDGFILGQEVTARGQGAIRVLGQAVAEFLKQQGERADAGDPENIFTAAVDGAVKILRGPLTDDPARPSIREAVDTDKAAAAQNALIPIPQIPQKPAFDATGWGRAGSGIVSAGFRFAAVSNWADSPAGPTYSFKTKKEQALFSVAAGPSPAAAWEIVSKLDDATADLYDIIESKVWANNRDGLARTEIMLAATEALDERGLAHDPENLANVVADMERLRTIQVGAIIDGWVNEPGKRGKQTRAVLSDAMPLLEIKRTQTLRRPGLEPADHTGELIGAAWAVNLGPWAAAMDSLDPKFAHMMRGIVQLHARNDRFAKRIGRYLIWQYRIKGTKPRAWQQPYIVEHLLQAARIPIDRHRPGEFRAAIERALDILASSHSRDMNGPICIGSWRYPDGEIEGGKSNRGWFDKWLAGRIAITPPDEIASLETGKYRGPAAKASRERAKSELAGRAKRAG